MTRRIQMAFAGHVSKTVLLTRLLPLSIASFFGTVIIAAFYFPVPYHWSVRVISKLTSPHDNPDAYWLPCLGFAVSGLLALPFAGYVQRHLCGITPRLARAAGAAFALAFVLLLLTGVVLPQRLMSLSAWHRIHESLARGSAGAFGFGMVCCCICAFSDRFRVFGGQRSLGTALSYYWGWVTLLPVAGALIIGVLVFLGQQADQAWAEQARETFRNTALWHLAFWEWFGSVAFFGFMLVTVLLLPEAIRFPPRTIPRRSRGLCREARRAEPG